MKCPHCGGDIFEKQFRCDHCYKLIEKPKKKEKKHGE